MALDEGQLKALIGTLTTAEANREAAETKSADSAKAAAIADNAATLADAQAKADSASLDAATTALNKAINDLKTFADAAFATPIA